MKKVDSATKRQNVVVISFPLRVTIAISDDPTGPGPLEQVIGFGTSIKRRGEAAGGAGLAKPEQQVGGAGEL